MTKMRPRYFILDEEHHVVPADLMTWALFYDTDKRFVAYTEFEGGGYVSTVFLGLDHRWWGNGPPIVFETMAFHTPLPEDTMDRYSSWDDAITGHKAMVRRVKVLMVKLARERQEIGSGER
jgi:hypothetical protein